MKTLRIFLLILIITGIILLCTEKIWVPKLATKMVGSQTTVVQKTSSEDYKNATYIIEGQAVKLGAHDYFGNEATGDLNNDGIPDISFIITQNGGGSGTFYYVVVALKTSDGYLGTNAVFLGDRIAPQTTEIKNGQLIVNYADRLPSQSFVVPPSQGVSKYLIVQGTILKLIK